MRMGAVTRLSSTGMDATSSRRPMRNGLGRLSLVEATCAAVVRGIPLDYTSYTRLECFLGLWLHYYLPDKVPCSPQRVRPTCTCRVVGQGVVGIQSGAIERSKNQVSLGRGHPGGKGAWDPMWCSARECMFLPASRARDHEWRADATVMESRRGWRRLLFLVRPMDAW